MRRIFWGAIVSLLALIYPLFHGLLGDYEPGESGFISLLFNIIFPIIFGIMCAFTVLNIKGKKTNFYYIIMILINFIIIVICYNVFNSVSTYNLVLTGLFGMMIFLHIRKRNEK